MTPRVKALQALLLVESGAADRYGLGAEELALACASHGGEPAHVARVRRCWRRPGLDESALECGAHWPLHQESARALARAGGAASAVHNNCSGKHAGFLCACCAMGADPPAMSRRSTRCSARCKAVLEDLGGAAIPDDNRATDGCSVPTWAMPLDRLALAFARFATGQGLGPRARTPPRGCGRPAPHSRGSSPAPAASAPSHDAFRCAGVRQDRRRGRLSAARCPSSASASRVKCDDGGTRAAEVATAAVIARLLPLDAADRAFLDAFVRPVLKNWRGIPVGGLRPTDALLPA